MNHYDIRTNDVFICWEKGRQWSWVAVWNRCFPITQPLLLHCLIQCSLSLAAAMVGLLKVISLFIWSPVIYIHFFFNYIIVLFCGFGIICLNELFVWMFVLVVGRCGIASFTHFVLNYKLILYLGLCYFLWCWSS